MPIAALSGGLPSYTGPGDIVSGATAWYGLRAYSAAVAATGTQKAVNIRASGDNATTDILILPTGKLDVATAAAFQTAHGGNLFVTAAYDQTWNSNDISQATAANQPQLNLSPLYLSFPAGASLNQSVTPSSGTMTFVGVAQRSVGTDLARIIQNAGTTNRNYMAFYLTPNLMRLNSSANNSTTQTVSDAAWHAAVGVIDATGVLNVDGVETTAAMGLGAASGTRGVSTTGTGVTMIWREAGIYEALAMSSGQSAALITNMRSAWGF